MSLFEATSRWWLPSLRLVELITYHGGSPHMSVPIRIESILNLIVLFYSLELRKSLRWLLQIMLFVGLFFVILQVFTYAHITGIFVRSAKLKCHSWYVAWNMSIKKGCRFIIELKLLTETNCLLKELSWVIWINYLRTPKVVPRIEAIDLYICTILASLITVNTKPFHKSSKMHGTAEPVHQVDTFYLYFLSWTCFVLSISKWQTLLYSSWLNLKW